MSATGHDAINGTLGTLRSLDVPVDAVPDAPDFTEDLADEITSELDAALQSQRPSTAGAPAEGDAHAAVAAATNGSSASGARLLRDRYLLEAPLGNGGTATVYRAVDQRRVVGAADEDGRVAIKLLRPELRDRPQSVARLQREFRQTQAVSHPNVVRFLDLDRDGDAWFIVMELLSGETLGPLLRRPAQPGLSGADALRIGCAVGDALAHAHSRGVTHGDVKPDNIFLTDAGDVRLFDFGVAPESAAHAPGDGAGVPVVAAATRVYASPEMLAGEPPEPRDDVFSLGCVIYEMVSGRHPYGRRGVDRTRDVTVVPKRLASLGPARASAVASALALARADRPTMAELVRVLRADEVAASTLPVTTVVPPVVAPRVVPAAAPVAASAAAAPIPKRSPLTLVVGLAAGLALVLGIVIGRLDAGTEPAAAPTPASQQLPEPQQQPLQQALPQSGTAAAQDSAAVPVAKATGQVELRDSALAPSGPPGLVFFDRPSMVVSKRAVVAAIPLRHLNRVRRPVSVHWRTIDGTARAGRDYGGPPSRRRIVRRRQQFPDPLRADRAEPRREHRPFLYGRTLRRVGWRGPRSAIAGCSHDPRRVLSARQRSWRSFEARMRAMGTAFGGKATCSKASMRAGIAVSAVSRSASGTGADSR